MIDEETLAPDADPRSKPENRPAGAHVRLYGKHFNLKLRLGDGPAQITDENSGWTTVDRPNDVAMTKWVGGQPLKMSIPIILDGWHRKESVRHKLGELHKLVRDKDGDEEPPTFIAKGPLPFSGHRWVMESIEYGDALRGERGTEHAQLLLRQELTLHLMQYVPADRIKFKTTGGKGHRKFYKARKGDTPLKVANKFFDHNVHDHARKICKLNSIRGIRTKIKAGRVIRLP